jgi:hypothetical protein
MPRVTVVLPDPDFGAAIRRPGAVTDGLLF